MHDGATGQGRTTGAHAEPWETRPSDTPPDGTYVPGSDHDFARLYVASYRRIFFTLYGILGDRAAAEDCAQDTFVLAYRAWSRWRPEAPAEAWLHRIGLRVALSYRRRERVRGLANLVRTLGCPEPAREENRDGAFLSALRRLPAEQAAAVVLRYHHGYTNREIAAALGIPESTVGSRLVKARARLQRELVGDEAGSRAPAALVDAAAPPSFTARARAAST